MTRRISNLNKKPKISIKTKRRTCVFCFRAFFLYFLRNLTYFFCLVNVADRHTCQQKVCFSFNSVPISYRNEILMRVTFRSLSWLVFCGKSAFRCLSDEDVHSDNSHVCSLNITYELDLFNTLSSFKAFC